MMLLIISALISISNHERGPNTHIMRFLERHGIPYHHLGTTKDDKREEGILNLVQDTDFLVLARYMQVYDIEGYCIHRLPSTCVYQTRRVFHQSRISRVMDMCPCVCRPTHFLPSHHATGNLLAIYYYMRF